jgi:hypothetical protein
MNWRLDERVAAEGGELAMGVMVRGVLECPTCGAEELEAVAESDGTNFLCRSCWDCWHIELGRVHRVNPETCLGCPHRDECLSRRAARN